MNTVDIKKLFADEGLRFTTQRKLVFNILNANKTPLTAEEIYINYLEKDQSISLSTIYRILEAFLNKNIVKKTYLTDDTKACYALNNHEHLHYLVCLDCKKIIEIDGCPFNSYEHELQDSTNFQITGHKLELYGYCPDCQ